MFQTVINVIKSSISKQVSKTVNLVRQQPSQAYAPLRKKPEFLEVQLASQAFAHTVRKLFLLR